MDVTGYAVAGYVMGDCPSYQSSPAGMAYLSGLAHRAAGRPMPKRAAMSRGYTVRIDGILYDTNKLPSLRDLMRAAGRGDPMRKPIDVPLPRPEEMRAWWPLRPEDLLGDRNDRNPYVHYVPRDEA